MSFGLDVPAFPVDRTDPVAWYRRLADAAAEAGFDRLWVGDHALWHRPRLETFTLLGLLAGQTELALGTAVLLAPLRRPMWIAKSAATIDNLTGGRFVLGVGVGGEHLAEFELMGVDPVTRGAATDEAIGVCRAAWSGTLHETFSPVPESGSIPIWVGGRSDAALRRAGVLGDGYIGIFVTPERFADAMHAVRTHRDALGRVSPVSGAIALWVACDATDGERARQQAAHHIEAEYTIPAARFERYLVAGTPAELRDTIGRYQDAGAEHIHLHIAHDDVLGQVRMLGTQVLPGLRDRVPARSTLSQEPR